MRRRLPFPLSPRLLGLVFFVGTCRALIASPEEYAWKPQFKLRNFQTGQHTAADFPGPGGPEGLVYPNFFFAGLPSGIPGQHPRYSNVVPLSRYPGFDNTGASDQWAVVMAAIEDLHAQGGGVLDFGPGTFRLTNSVLIPYDNIVLRGAGRTATKIDFRPGITDAKGDIVRGIKWLFVRDGDEVPHDFLIQVRAMQPSDRWTNNADFDYIRIFVDGVPRASTTTDRQGGPTLVTLRASDVNSGISRHSTHVLAAEIRYGDGAVYRAPELRVHFGEQLPYGRRRLVAAHAAFSFSGDEWSRRGPRHTFTLGEDALRGATLLKFSGDLPNFPLIQPGEIVLLEKPAHGGGFLVERGTTIDRGSRYLLTVVATNGTDTLQVAEPLREDFLVASNSRLKSAFMPVRNVGVEDLWIDQSAEQVWTSGIHFENAYQAWVRNVQVTKIGRFPVWLRNSKNVEIRDVVFREAWYRIGGGTAYIGAGESNDILFDRVAGSRLRHGPNFGSYASGNVVRNGSFDGMDAHVGHNAWVAENLIELSRIDARQPDDLPKGSSTSYGPAITHEPRDGPQGPRSVFYNNVLKADLRSTRPAIDTSGGMEANYYIGNEIHSVGPTVLGARRDIDFVFEDNVIVLHGREAGVAYLPGENRGWEFRRNRVYGGTGKLLHRGSADTPGVDQGNIFRRKLPEPKAALLRDSLTAPSLYQWQLEKKYPRPPEAPTDLAVRFADGRAYVTWKPSRDAAAYVVRWGRTAEHADHESAGHVAPTATITHLRAGETYFFRVAAINPKGRSQETPVVQVSAGSGAN